MNFFTQSAIAMLLLGVTAPMINAETMPKAAMPSSMEVMTDSRPNWEITSIDGDKLMVKGVGSDMSQTFMIQPDTASTLNLQPGTIIELNYDNLMVGEIVSATQTNLEIEIGGERMTYIIPESGSDYDLSDQLAVTPDRILGKVSEWQLSEADITVLTPAQNASSMTETTDAAPSTEAQMEAETVPQKEAEIQYGQPVRGMW